MRLHGVVSAFENSEFDVRIQPSIGEARNPDLLLFSRDGQRVILIEVKDNVFTADVASVNLMVKDAKKKHPSAEGMIIYSAHAPSGVEEMAAEQGIKVIRGVGNAKAELLNA